MPRRLRDWLFGRHGRARWQEIAHWGEAQGWQFKTTPAHDGFVMERAGADGSVRIEWGPSQRRYLGKWELRLRAETGLDPQAYALLMPRVMMEGLEREVFVQFTGGVQTRLDEETPEEMRWLAMSPRLGPAQMGSLKSWFAAVGNSVGWLAGWLHSGLGDRLLHWGRLADEANAAGSAVGQLPTFALLMYRGHLVMRRALSEPEVSTIRDSLALFDEALREARLRRDGFEDVAS
jgi:hypothetical protein